ncbi:MAG: hypothetical protein IT378_26095, partial [Sandaracinaceae bacterium]|nr:hypothetical protein [Sandaracinaceae bacterium]
MQKRARVMALFLLTACGGTPAASGDGGLADAPPAASCEGAANGSPCAAALPSICLSGACVASRCGDGIVDPRAEVCDDGNDTGGDGCERTCRTSCDTPECQASECRPCSTSADCAGGSCVRYGESDVAWCSIACESDSDCAGLPGFTRCGGGYCAHDSVVSACSPDGTRTQFLDRCERVLAEEPCEADDRCVPLATGGHTCRALAPAPACARCERDAQCDSGSCLFYEDYPDAGFCSTTCTSDADCAGLAGLTRCSMGWCVHTGFTQECTGTQTYALVDSCGLVLASGACENSD